LSRGQLLDRIEDHSALVGVVGLGYVGLPVATTFSAGGFRVVGVDTSEARVAAIEQNRPSALDVDEKLLGHLRRNNRLTVGTSYNALADADVILICVPTPVSDGQPDLSAIRAAGRAIGRVLTPETLVVLESTTYPGTTEEILRPLLEGGDLVAGRDFLLAFSPERIDPGNEQYAFSDIPKVVGGIDKASTRAAEMLYSQVVPKVVTVGGTAEAEMSKLIENTFRHVNIALINELAVYANEMKIDIWEAIEAAATKPFGFLPFWPGPGWGGHCIPLDPSYLSWRVRQDRAHEVRFIELAQTVNSEMPRHIVERASLLLNDAGKAVRNARILGIGVAYKGGTDDTRHSSGLKILGSLAARGARISYHDPLVASALIGKREFKSKKLSNKLLSKQDLVLVFVPQVDVDWPLVAAASPLVLDCCNAMRKKNGKLHRL
jgi:UDP-N-acetyl-D-glucosamine dehydrogenase